MFIISDTAVLSAVLSQKENRPPKLIIQKPADLPYLPIIEVDNMFMGKITHVETKRYINIIEYTMPFEEWVCEPKEIMFGHPDQMGSYIEDTEHVFHFHRLTRRVELSHIQKGHRIHEVDGPILSSYVQRPYNIKAMVSATWVYECDMMIDLMPYIGDHIDTYTPIPGFKQTEDIEVKGPYEHGQYLKKVRHKGPFYHRIVEKMPIEESMIYTMNYGYEPPQELTFHIPHGFGESFLTCEASEAWKHHIKKMLKRLHLLQSRFEIITLQLPFLNVTLDDEIILGHKRGKVIEYRITPFLTTVTFAVVKDMPYQWKESDVTTKKEVKERMIMARVKNDAQQQELILAQTGSIQHLPKTIIEFTVV